METIPTEVLELICCDLLSSPPTYSAAIPCSTRKERRDLYNVRESCRVLRGASSKAFLGIIQDVPFYCTAKSMGQLTLLLQDPSTAEKIAQLTIAGFKVDTSQAPKAQIKWRRNELLPCLTAILKSVPQLRHIRCLPETELNAKPPNLDDSLWLSIRECMPIILQHVHTAVRAASLSEQLKSFTAQISSNPSDPGTSACQRDDMSQPGLRPALLFPYPLLQHVTLELSLLQPLLATLATPIPPRLQFDPISPLLPLKSLNILLEQNMFPWGDLKDMGCALRDLARFKPVHLILTGFTHWGIFDCDIQTLLRPFSRTKPCFERLTLLRTLVDLYDEIEVEGRSGGLEKDFLIRELELVDVKWRLSVNKVLEEGPCLDGWDTMPSICAFADVVRVRNGTDPVVVTEKPDDLSDLLSKWKGQTVGLDGPCGPLEYAEF